MTTTHRSDIATNRHHAARVRAVTYDHVENDGMDTTSLPQLSSDVASNYGTDVDLPSDYGSDLDIELEEKVLSNVLGGIAATAPKKLVYSSTKADDEVSELAVVVHTSLSPTAVRSDPAASKSALATPRGKRRVSIEVEYDRRSRQTWSGMRIFNTVRALLD